MGAKGRKSLTKKLQKKSLKLVVATPKKDVSADFLPLEGGPARKLPEKQSVEDGATVLYIGRIPHGFYEDEMAGFFKQFGTVKRLRLARNRMTGKSKHYGFIEFEYPEVAKIVAETMHNQLLFEHLLQVHLIPQDCVPPRLWKGVTRRYKPLNWVDIERKMHNKERTLEEQQRLVQGIMKRDEKRRNRIKAAGIDYDCPEFVRTIRFSLFYFYLVTSLYLLLDKS